MDMTNSLLNEQKKHLMDEVYAALKKEGFSQKKRGISMVSIIYKDRHHAA
jgi:hypothetical protein